MSDADVKLDIGRDLTRGLGAGSDPEVGRTAAESHSDEIDEMVKGADMVFITAGEGGGTGTGAAPSSPRSPGPLVRWRSASSPARSRSRVAGVRCRPTTASSG